MRRLLFTALSALSFVVSVAAMALWVRSFWNSGRVEFMYRNEKCTAWIVRGKVGVDNSPFVADETTNRAREMWIMTHAADEQGLYADPPTRVPAAWSHSSSALLPVLVLMTATLPIRQLRQWQILRHRSGQVLCSRCGYDLRASPARCPECGAVPAKKN